MFCDQCEFKLQMPLHWKLKDAFIALMVAQAYPEVNKNSILSRLTVSLMDVYKKNTQLY
jgi:hypothetical protein